MTGTRIPRRTTDTPTQRAPRRGIDISALALRYATPLRASYLVCIAIATLLKLGFDPSVPHALTRLQRAFDPALSFRDIVDAARNIALFLGWGATWVLTSPAPTSRRDVVLATLWGMAASIVVETAQVFSQFRMASIVDVGTNTLGSLLGALTLWLAERRATSDLRRGTLIGIPGWIAGGALLMSAAGLTFAPSTRATRVIGWGPTPMARAQFVADAPGVTVSWLALISDVAVWATVGIALAVAISDRTGRVRRSQLIAWLAITAMLLVVVHLGRSFAGLQREIGSWQVQSVAAAVGLVVGLVAVPSWRNRVSARSTRALQLGMLVAVLGAVTAWSPASWALPRSGNSGLDWRQLVPMMSLFQRQDLSSVFIVLQKAGIGAALGACLAARTRMGEPLPGVRAAVAYAALLEAGQLLVPGRYPDVTDILIMSAAAGLVAVLVERADRGAREVAADVG